MSLVVLDFQEDFRHTTYRTLGEFTAEGMIAQSSLLFLVLISLMALISSAETEAICAIEESSDDCSIDSFVADVTFVYPGGNTRCYYDTYEAKPNPFLFQVYQRSRESGVPSNNLHIHFAGGGFCTGLQETCLTTSPNIFQFIWSFFFGGIAFAFVQPEIKPHTGLFKASPDNPFSEDWTHIRILYCSGDTHLGNTTTNQEGLEYRGAVNVLSALQWTYRNIPNPERLLLTGQSAGSLGLQHWSHSILKHYKTTSDRLGSKTVVLDSYVGVMERANVQLRHNWGICNDVFDWSDELMEKCQSQLLEPRDAQLNNQLQHPDTPFAFMNHKFDYIQQNSACDLFCTQQRLYHEMQDLLLGLTESNNMVSYFVNGIGHSSLDKDALFSRGKSNIWNPGVSLSEWIRRMVYRTPDTIIRSYCTWWFFPFLDWSCNKELRAETYQDV